jgi:endoglucanase
MVHINPSPQDKNVWDIQIRHKEFVIVTGHTYNVKFRVKATKPCKVRAKVGDADDGRNWKEFWFKEVDVTTNWQEITGTFTPGKNGCPEGYTIVEYTMHFGGNNRNGNTDYDIFFDDMSLTDDQFKPTATPVPTPNYNIRVNQLGYFPDAAKKATFVTSATHLRLFS